MNVLQVGGAVLSTGLDNAGALLTSAPRENADHLQFRGSGCLALLSG